MSEGSLLRATGLTIRFRERFTWNTAVEGVALDLPPGGRLALLGESGSGKSVTALALLGLLPPPTAVGGTVLWRGETRPPRLGRDAGVVFQDPLSSLNPVLTVAEQVAEVLVTHEGSSWRAAGSRAADLLARVGLAEVAARRRAYPHELSGGQRQRVALAAAVAARPRLLVADEPTTALDTVTEAGIVALIEGLVRDEGMALLLITHDLALAARLAPAALLLRRGRCVEAGPLARLVRSPREPYTAEFMRASLAALAP